MTREEHAQLGVFIATLERIAETLGAQYALMGQALELGAKVIERAKVMHAGAPVVVDKQDANPIGNGVE